MLTRPSPDLRSERGVMLVIFAILLPLILIIGSMVVSIGSWYTHGRHLQTKVDAAAFAGGGSWAFPCAADVDVNIDEYARRYVGQHMKADGTPYTTTTYNPQVGKVRATRSTSFSMARASTTPTRTRAPRRRPIRTGRMCDAKILDVKGTEQDSPLLWGWLRSSRTSRRRPASRSRRPKESETSFRSAFASRSR